MYSFCEGTDNLVSSSSVYRFLIEKLTLIQDLFGSSAKKIDLGQFFLQEQKEIFDKHADFSYYVRLQNLKIKFNSTSLVILDVQILMAILGWGK